MSTEQPTTQAEDYAEVYRRSVRDPERFWLEAARAVEWTREPTVALDATTAPLYRWFPDGELNTSYNALDRHVAAGHGERTALIYDSALLGVQERYSYARLRDEVALFAGALAARGVGRGDRVLVYLPMIPQAAVAMLACARLGAVHSVVFGGFAPQELASRIDDSRPRVVVTTTGGLEPTRRIEYIPAIEEALRLARHEPGTVIVHERPGFATTVEHARERAGHGEQPAVEWLDWGAGARGGHRSAVRPLHLGHHRRPEGGGAGQRRARRGADVVHAPHLRRGPRRGDVDGLRRGVGGGPLLHRLRPAARRGDDRALRGQARGHPGRRRVLAACGGPRGEGPLHRPHGPAGHPPGGPGGRAGAPARHRLPAGAVRGGGAAGPGDLRLGLPGAGRAGGRPLVADGDRVGDLRQPLRDRAAAPEARLAVRAGARLPGGGPGPAGAAGPDRRGGQHRPAPAPAPGRAHHAVG
jgi:hypothetical protein